ncbi:MAG TPA: ADOP family duplicated permease [Bryobacteraceae bacterium]|jgi:predicted permease|nr:ADOP family duplicated permease [Bryobacteraceae bacterium]
MSWWTRISNAIRGDRLGREIDEELESHIAEAIEQGRDPAEARRAFGGALRTREECRDSHVLPWLASLHADSVFAWRQFAKHKVTSAAAVLSLALAIGACTSAFRLIDALLLRPLPVVAPEQLYTVVHQSFDPKGAPFTDDQWAYPCFTLMRTAVKGQAELLAVSYAARTDLTYKSDAEMEKADVQYVSGWLFDSFGLRPAAGRLFNADDDSKPRAHAYAVLSYDYWTRRFGRDPKAVGRTLQMGSDLYQIVGVGPEPFTGTETGTVTDIFVPTMMHPGVTHDDWTWFRTMVRVHPGTATEPLRARLESVALAFERERAKSFKNMPQASIDLFLRQKIGLQPAAAGASGLQKTYSTALAAIGVLVALVLLIACANVANLTTAQAASRAREMALRVSIGAGRARLVQLVLVLVESAWLAAFSAALGAWLAWWSAPFVVSRINPPDNPARLALPADWRVLAFAIALTLAVTLLFGLAPALRASKINPASALRGGSSSPHARRRLMHALIAAQVSFCFVVLFLAGLFVATFDHLSHFPLGFSADRLLVLETVAPAARPPVFWEQAADHLQSLPGVEKTAISGWPLLDGNGWNGFVSVNGAPPGPVLAYFLAVSPGWRDTMKTTLLDGHDLRADDGSPAPALVNETFVKDFLKGLEPIGAQVAKDRVPYRVVGVVRDTPYRSLREPILPAVFVPLRDMRTATIVVRTAAPNPLAIASMLRHEVSGARVSNLRSQMDLVQAQTVRERLLAMLAMFFAAVALVLAGIGLYGVLDYTVLQRRREIGIRMAVGAQAGDIALRLTVEVLRVVFAGALVGLALGLLAGRYIATLLYEVSPGDPAMLAIPAAVILGVSLIAALPAVLHAVQIDPVSMLRAD